MKILFKETFGKDLKKIEERKIKEKIRQIITDIERYSNIREIKNCKKIKGHINAYRIKIRDYRIGFFYENNSVIFSRILHRKDIYRKFP